MAVPGLVPLCFYPLKGKNLAALMRGWHARSKLAAKIATRKNWSVIFVCLTNKKSTGAIAEVNKQNIQGTSLGARRAKLTTSSGFVAVGLMASAGRATKVKLRRT